VQLGTFEQMEFQDIFGCLLVALFRIGIKVKVSASQKERESNFSAKKRKEKEMLLVTCLIWHFLVPVILPKIVYYTEVFIHVIIWIPQMKR
jgi:hypothetical protein